MSRVTWQSRVSNPNGVHCRVAAKLAEIAAAYKAHVWITGRGEPVDCSSILELLSLSLVQDSLVSFTAEGPEAAQAAEAIDRLFSSGAES